MLDSGYHRPEALDPIVEFPVNPDVRAVGPEHHLQAKIHTRGVANRIMRKGITRLVMLQRNLE